MGRSIESTADAIAALQAEVEAPAGAAGGLSVSRLVAEQRATILKLEAEIEARRKKTLIMKTMPKELNRLCDEAKSLAVGQNSTLTKKHLRTVRTVRLRR